MVGLAGAPGAAGDQGAIGATGRTGPAGVVERWVSYKDFTFDNNQADISVSQMDQVTQIAAYMKLNPSLKCGIDATDARTDAQHQNLSDQRASGIRVSLIQAGVPADKISAGAFGDKQLRRDGRVEVLICTAN
jgi:outer membrane protein OmpA-like peptidoglycan-associated protein